MSDTTRTTSRRASRPVVVVGVAIGAVLVLNGVALAYRTGQTVLTGTGTASVSGEQLTFTLSGASTDALYPGGPEGTVDVTLTNPFSAVVTVTGVTATVTPTEGQGTCGAADFTTSTAGIPATVSPGSAGYPVSVAMKPTASNGCQGAHIGLTVTITGNLS